MVKILNMTFPGIKKTAVSIVLVCLSAVSVIFQLR